MELESQNNCVYQPLGSKAMNGLSGRGGPGSARVRVFWPRAIRAGPHSCTQDKVMSLISCAFKRGIHETRPTSSTHDLPYGSSSSPFSSTERFCSCSIFSRPTTRRDRLAQERSSPKAADKSSMRSWRLSSSAASERKARSRSPARAARLLSKPRGIIAAG